MTNKEAIERWAKFIIPVVFRAEDALKKAHPEWNDRLAHLCEEGGEDPHQVAEEYCHDIAEIILKFYSTDYDPDEECEAYADDSEDTADQGATVV